jgi:hypothetical protein
LLAVAGLILIPIRRGSCRLHSFVAVESKSLEKDWAAERDAHATKNTTSDG